MAGDKKRVLIVEDEDSDYKILTQWLKKVESFKDCEIERVLTAEDATEEIKSGKFDIVFLDLCIPLGEISEEIAEQEWKNGLKVFKEYTELEPAKRPMLVIYSRLIKQKEVYEELRKIMREKGIYVPILSKELIQQSQQLEAISDIEKKNLEHIFIIFRYGKEPGIWAKKLIQVAGLKEDLADIASFIIYQDVYKTNEYEKEIKELDELIKNQNELKNVTTCDGETKQIEVNVKTEYDPLEFVIVHEPNQKGELAKVDVSNAKEYLFDAPVNIEEFTKQHGTLIDKIGKEKCIDFIKGLLEPLLKHKEYGRFLTAVFLWKITRNIELYWRMVEETKCNADEVIKFAFAGKNKELEIKAIPNFVFTRDWAFVVHDYVFLPSMRHEVRKREVEIARFVFHYHPAFNNVIDLEKELELGEEKGTIEGGDVLLVKPDTLFIGLSERTTFTAAKKFIDKIVKNKLEGIEQVYVVNAPREHVRSMHLDTFLGIIDEKHAIVYKKALEEEFFVYKWQRKGGSIVSLKNLKDILKEVEITEVIELKDDKAQQNDCCNIFAIEPGKFIMFNEKTLEGGGKVFDKLKELGLYDKDKLIEGSELVLARGGPHCLTLPIKRKSNDS